MQRFRIERVKGRTLLSGLLFALVAVSLSAAEPQGGEGQAQFERACAGCHGAGGTGGRGPSLRKSLAHGNEASDIRAVIVNGLAGGMPKFHFDPDELKPLVAYVQSLSQGGVNGGGPEHGGDTANGRHVYEAAACAGCHKIAGEGSAFGPNLTRIGSTRSYEYLKTSILKPSEDVAEEYGSVAIVTNDGRSLTGVRVNEDSFTLQVRLPDQSFVSFEKGSLRQETALTSSPMPAFKGSEQELTDLLAYLASLSGGSADDGPRKGKRR